MANDAFRSKEAGHLVPNDSPPITIADGLKTNVRMILQTWSVLSNKHNNEICKLGDKTWPIIKDYVDDIITVSEDEIRSALFLAYERMKIVLEPSAAVGIAVALSTAFKSKWGSSQRVGIVLCGGKTIVKLYDIDFMNHILSYYRKRGFENAFHSFWYSRII